MTHKQVWDAIDKMAKAHNMTPSGMAVAAGLDATTFNESKRFNRYRQERWPVMKSIVMVCNALNVPFTEFFKYV